MAADKATLITSIQAALNGGVGVDDDALQISTAIGDAIDIYAKTLTGIPSPGPTPPPFLDSSPAPCTGTIIIS